MGQQKLRIFLADDHPLVRTGLKGLIDAQHDMLVVGEASDGRTTWADVQRLTPDVVVMDLNMPDTNGTRVTEWIKRDAPTTKVLILTLHEEQGYLRHALEVGASGYVLKRAGGDEVILAIRAVAAGGVYLDPALTSRLVGAVAPQSAYSTPNQRSMPLSDRERTVLQGVARGYSHKELGQQLAISVKTVETYRARVVEKLGLTSRAAIVRYALHQGWLDDD